MTGKLKALGLALVAVFAMSAMGASAAQAEGVFQWAHEGDTATIEADPNTPSQIFEVETKSGGHASFTCNELKASVKTPTGTSSATLSAEGIVFSDTGTTPKENLCTGKVGESAVETEVNLNGCGFTFHAGTTINGKEGEPGTGTTEGTVDIACPEGKVIEVKAPGCTVKVSPQTERGPIYFHTTNTEGHPEEVTAEALVGTAPGKLHNKSLSYQTSGAVCGAQATREGGTYTGTATIKGYTKEKAHEPANQTNVTVT